MKVHTESTQFQIEGRTFRYCPCCDHFEVQSEEDPGEWTELCIMTDVWGITHADLDDPNFYEDPDEEPEYTPLQEKINYINEMHSIECGMDGSGDIVFTCEHEEKMEVYLAEI